MTRKTAPLETPPLKTAMILAAGFGTRMQHLTQTCPKPLLPYFDRPIIDYTVERLRHCGIERIIINAHYMADLIVEHFKGQPDIHVIVEQDILETGGGIKNALPLIGHDPLLVINGDTFWDDKEDAPLPQHAPSPKTFGKHTLEALTHTWHHIKDPEQSMLLLLYPAHQNKGDFAFRQDPTTHAPAAITWFNTKHPHEAQNTPEKPFFFTGIQIVHPALYKQTHKIKFSNKDFFITCAQNNTLYGHPHTGVWYHFNTPECLTATCAH